MEFYDVIHRRRSIRKYKAQPVPAEKLQRVLEAGRKAPSWANKQCWRFILIDDEHLRSKLNEIMGGNPGDTVYTDAPYTLVICADPFASGKKDGKEYYMFDVGIALENIMLAAAEEGLGTCCIGWFDERSVRNLLGIPEEYRVVALTPIGYPDEEPAARPRKEMKELLYINGWGKTE
jgi:nitroreductase